MDKAMDKTIDKLINKVQTTGLANNTIIMFISDNSTVTDSPVSISGLTFIHGNAGTGPGAIGGAIFSAESLTVKKSVVSGDKGSIRGGVAV